MACRGIQERNATLYYKMLLNLSPNGDPVVISDVDAAKMAKISLGSVLRYHKKLSEMGKIEVESTRIGKPRGRKRKIHLLD